MLSAIIRFFLENKVITWIVLGLLIIWGLVVSPLDPGINGLPRSPVAVDAIPDLGENQQIIFTRWNGHSPQDVEDQITYPLSVQLLGIPGIRTIRSSSMYGYSSIYLIFEEDVEFYWSRSRILEKLNSLPGGTLPEGVQPTLGPDATGLGQIFWYTLEGRDEAGQPNGGWDLQELRSVQDYQVKYSLASVKGVAEVASIGGYVKEYQVDVDPVALQAYQISISQVMNAVRNSNQEIGAKTIEINRVEYLVRGLGYIRSIEDLENAVVTTRNSIPVRVKDVGRVSLGPANRRGVLDKGGTEVVGGVVVARYGENPLAVIDGVKKRIEAISAGLPSRELADGSQSKITVVPFYDRSGLIHETLGTLGEALTLEILLTIIVIILMVMNLRASLLISSMLPFAVLLCFIAMRHFGVDANIVALSGIAIAIGTIVDMGIVLSENMIRHLEQAPEGKSKLEIIFEATREVGSAVVTAVATTVISFLPVFTLESVEGKLFRPLAFTKTFALLSSVFIALVFLPAAAHWLFSLKIKWKAVRTSVNLVALLGGIILTLFYPALGLLLIGAAAIGLANLVREFLPPKWQNYWQIVEAIMLAMITGWFLASAWLPLGPQKSFFSNYLFVIFSIGGVIGTFYLLIHFYERILKWALRNKLLFLSIPLVIVLFGIFSWRGSKKTLPFLPESFHESSLGQSLASTFPGLKREFMPALDEGAFLLMPTSMVHAGMEENMEILKTLDMAVQAIPEVDMVVGKAGRVESALDPAPISMYENIISYKSEFKSDSTGKLLRFRVTEAGEFERDGDGELIPDPGGQYFRQWRDHIRTPDDIWAEIDKIRIPGVAPAPLLQPIQTRLIMLQTGMRAPIGIRIKGTDPDTIQAFGLKLEELMKSVEGIKPEKVIADRVTAKPYLEIEPDRKALARYGLTVVDFQRTLQGAIGGMPMTYTVEGRERYAVRVRYPRELRSDPEKMRSILVNTPTGSQVPLGELARLTFSRGPQVIKSEDQFFVSFVLLDSKKDYSASEVVANGDQRIKEAVKSGEIRIPAGVTYEFAGEYENQVRADKRLMLVLPIALVLIFLILYLQFRSVAVSMMIFTGIIVAFAGGFIMLWAYGQDWFLDFSFLGVNLRELFNMDAVKLSTAVWVGFLALFGIATDDGVVMATYLKQSFEGSRSDSIAAIRENVVEAGARRVRPCLMTTATTLLALLPVLSATGRGADIMVPMAIPSFGGMAVEIITLFIIPVVWSAWKEREFKTQAGRS